MWSAAAACLPHVSEHTPTTMTVPTAATASRSLAKRAFKFTLPGSAYAYCYGTVAMSPIPTFDTGSVMRRTVNISIDGLFTFFEA